MHTPPGHRAEALALASCVIVGPLLGAAGGAVLSQTWIAPLLPEWLGETVTVMSGGVGLLAGGVLASVARSAALLRRPVPGLLMVTPALAVNITAMMLLAVLIGLPSSSNVIALGSLVLLIAATIVVGRVRRARPTPASGANPCAGAARDAD